MKDTDLMPFGKFKRTTMANVPAYHLQWIKNNVKPNPKTFEVLRYIKDNWDAIELEL